MRDTKCIPIKEVIVKILFEFFIYDFKEEMTLLNI